MTIQDLGSLGELLAAVATLATLGYLAVQVGQARRQLEALLQVMLTYVDDAFVQAELGTYA